VLCPIPDWSAETASRRELDDAYLLDRATMRRELACFLGPNRQVEHPEVSPLRASGGDVYHICHPGTVQLLYGLGQVVPNARETQGRIGQETRVALA
jgi:hypothetical protein